MVMMMMMTTTTTMKRKSLIVEAIYLVWKTFKQSKTEGRGWDGRDKEKEERPTPFMNSLLGGPALPAADSGVLLT